jgi:hypothetical protein
MPQAGVAVNLDLAARSPEKVAELLRLMVETVESLKGRPIADLAALFPREAAEALGPEVLAASLTREPLIIRSAQEAEKAMNEFLALAAPELFEADGGLPASFVWRPEGPIPMDNK